MTAQAGQYAATNHTLRRTFASLLYEAGVAGVCDGADGPHELGARARDLRANDGAQPGHTGERMDALLRGADWARMGTNGAVEGVTVAVDGNEEARFTAS